MNDNDECKKWKISTIVLAILLLLCMLKSHSVVSPGSGEIGARIITVT